jgi:hypothetical protein
MALMLLVRNKLEKRVQSQLLPPLPLSLLPVPILLLLLLPLLLFLGFDPDLELEEMLLSLILGDQLPMLLLGKQVQFMLPPP